MYLGVFKGKDYPLVSALEKKAWLLPELKRAPQRLSNIVEMLHTNFSWFKLALSQNLRFVLSPTTQRAEN